MTTVTRRTMSGSFAIWLPALVLAVVGLAGCAAPPTPLPQPLATWPVLPEVLPDPTSGSDTAMLTCGGRAFPADGLDAPDGAETASGPEFDALRAALTKFADAFPAAPGWTWRLAGRDDTGAVFLSQTLALGPPGWVSIEVSRDAFGWKPLTMGQCEPHVVLSAEFGPATWGLDPAFPMPDAKQSEFHILVWERSCSGGVPTTGRMSAPVVQYSADAVTVTIGVRPVKVEPGILVTCPGPPGTPAILRLSEPLGTRTLLDGGVTPPAPPTVGR